MTISLRQVSPPPPPPPPPPLCLSCFFFSFSFFASPHFLKCLSSRSRPGSLPPFKPLSLFLSLSHSLSLSLSISFLSLNWSTSSLFFFLYYTSTFLSSFLSILFLFFLPNLSLSLLPGSVLSASLPSAPQLMKGDPKLYLSPRKTNL